MGASGSQFQNTFLQFLNDDPVNSLLSEEINQLTYQQFLDFLGELNSISKGFLDSNGNQLIFAVKKDTDSTIFWKATVQIACVKIAPDTQKVQRYRLLTLSEFLKVVKTLKSQVIAAEHSERASGPSVESDVALSKFLDNIDVESSSDECNECCICFERKQEVILPCAHSFCTQCIEEWNLFHDTCPICREKLDSPDDTWVLSEVPRADEISKEIHNNLLDLTGDRTSQCSPS